MPIKYMQFLVAIFVFGQCTNRPSLQNLSISEKLEREVECCDGKWRGVEREGGLVRVVSNRRAGRRGCSPAICSVSCRFSARGSGFERALPGDHPPLLFRVRRPDSSAESLVLRRRCGGVTGDRRAAPANSRFSSPNRKSKQGIDRADPWLHRLLLCSQDCFGGERVESEIPATEGIPALGIPELRGSFRVHVSDE
jgi:hypothetical protein